MPDNSWVDPQDFNANSRLRASDADRDTAAAVVNNALAEGRLTAEEHSERLDAIFSAKTHADLVPRPGRSAGAPRRAAGPRPPAVCRRRPEREAGAAAWSRFQRGEPQGRLASGAGDERAGRVRRRGTGLPGGGPAGQGDRADGRPTVLGGLEITVPPEMRVVDNGTAILGGREIAGDSAEASSPDAPVLRIEGTCVLGGVEVKRKARKVPKELRRGKASQRQRRGQPAPGGPGKARRRGRPSAARAAASTAVGSRRGAGPGRRARPPAGRWPAASGR